METLEQLPLVCAETDAVPGHAASLLPPGGPWKLVWHDEFDGDALDGTKWGFRTNFWGRRAHWFAGPEDGAVEVRDSVCRLKLVKKPDGRFATPQLQTGGLVWDVPRVENPKGFWPLPKREPPRFMHRFGYYECRCRTQQMPGWWSAFWMQSPMQGCSLDPRRAGVEHDIMESFEPGKLMAHALHMNGCGAEYARFRAPRGITDGDRLDFDKTVFHRFGMLWEPDGYTFFVDGRQHGEKVGGGPGEAVSRTEEFILVSTEAMWYRNDGMTGEGVPELEDAWRAGDDFLVDYVRVFDPAP